ncbi:MAG: cyclodeaminase/cyclohydrolase family protein [Oscillospiraceae bacterium]
MLRNMNLTEFVDLLGSDAPAPGGGAAAAVNGALGVALSSMVASLTKGKKKYAEYQPFILETLSRAEILKTKFLLCMDKDADTFGEMSAVFVMPNESDDEKEARKIAMQKALKSCTMPPLEMMELSLDALEVTKSLLGKSNTTALSDLGVSAINLKSAAMSAWLNVLININMIKDDAFVSEKRKYGEEMLKKAVSLADEIYDYTVKNI